MKIEVKWNWKKMLLQMAALLLGQLAICGACAALTAGEIIPEHAARMLVRVLSALSIYLVCWLGVKNKCSKMQIVMLIAACFIALCLLGGAILFPMGKTDFSVWMLLPFGAAILGAVTATTRKQYRR